MLAQASSLPHKWVLPASSLSKRPRHMGHVVSTTVKWTFRNNPPTNWYMPDFSVCYEPVTWPRFAKRFANLGKPFCEPGPPQGGIYRLGPKSLRAQQFNIEFTPKPTSLLWLSLSFSWVSQLVFRPLYLGAELLVLLKFFSFFLRSGCWRDFGGLCLLFNAILPISQQMSLKCWGFQKFDVFLDCSLDNNDAYKRPKGNK